MVIGGIVKFRTKVILSIILTAFVCTIAAIGVSTYQIRKVGEQSLISKASAILSRLEQAREFVASQGGLADSIKSFISQYPDGILPKSAKERVLNQVPIVASMKIGKANSEKENYEFRIFSFDPRNKDNTPNENETKILNRFEENPEMKQIVETDEDFVRVYRPISLSENQGCLNCHGDPVNSVLGNGKDILGFKMENWKDGYLHGVFGVIMKKDELKEASMAAIINISTVSFVLILISLALAFMIIRTPMNNLMNVAQALKDSGERVAQASNEISNSSQSLSSSATEAAASIEETTASTEEMSSMIKLNADHASEAKVLSEAAQGQAQSGKDEVNKLVESMGEISTSSRRVEEIISVIDDIAFQTNLLALNAAVEAARAGEQGRGFSVVAEAVRTLAQRSALSAKEISGLIKESVEKINVGSEQANASGAVLNEIVKTIEKVAHLNADISVASSEQASGVSQINKAINELDKTTQMNAAAAEQTAASSMELSDQSRKLHELVEQLISVIDGKST